MNDPEDTSLHINTIQKRGIYNGPEMMVKEARSENVRMPLQGTAAEKDKRKDYNPFKGKRDDRYRD